MRLRGTLALVSWVRPSSLRWSRRPLACGKQYSTARSWESLDHGLRNDYFALRHGQSLANVAGLIAASPQIACENYGLSDLGWEQAKLAGTDVLEAYRTGDYLGLVVLSSDLLRAFETATAVQQALVDENIPLYSGDVVLETRLRERGFGDWDGTSDANYAEVWKEDAIDPSHTIKGVESVVATMERTTGCILDWESRLENHMIVCVAHGDVLQILQTAFEGKDGSLHRTLPHLETAKLRPLVLKA